MLTIQTMSYTLGIVGSRCFTDYSRVEKEINFFIEFINQGKPSKIISGGAIGIDTLASVYAKNNNIAMITLKPEWKRFGKSAGYIRNKDIIDQSDYILAIWDGKSKGTKHSIDLAKAKNTYRLRIITIQIDE